MKDSSASVSRVCFKTNINLESGLNSGESYLNVFESCVFYKTEDGSETIEYYGNRCENIITRYPDNTLSAGTSDDGTSGTISHCNSKGYVIFDGTSFTYDCDQDVDYGSGNSGEYYYGTRCENVIARNNDPALVGTLDGTPGTINHCNGNGDVE